jgi:hypothetical protein
MIGNAAQDISKPGLRVDVVELGGGVHDERFNLIYPVA